MKSTPPRIGLKDWLPPLLVDGLRAARSWLQVPRVRALLRANGEWRDRYAGEPVYIIANGPSVGRFDRSLLAGTRVIVMNNFHKASWKDEVHPVAHCIGEPPDSRAWIDPSEAINGTACDSYWLCAAAHGHVRSAASDKRLHYVLAGYEPRIWGERPIRLDRLTLGYQTTAQLAIQVALHMGFKEIRLLGFDHDWLASPEFSRHFYSDEKDPEDGLGTFAYYELITFSQRMWEAYYALLRAGTAHGARIINMTDGSYLDVFPRQAPAAGVGP
jgi:hypothetical protein